jgi:Flp pilus assembly protein TadG
MFIIVLLGVVEMSRMILVYTSLANAARAGTRYAIVHGSDRTGSGTNGASGPGCGPSSCTQINTVVQQFAGTGLLNGSNVAVVVNYPGGTNTPGSTVTVSVTYTYDPLVAFFSRLLNKTLGSTSEGVITF